MRIPRGLGASWPRASSFSGEVLLSFAVNVAVAGLNVVSGVLLARLLGPEGRGQLLAIQALPLVVASVGMLGLQDAIILLSSRVCGARCSRTACRSPPAARPRSSTSVIAGMLVAEEAGQYAVAVSWSMLSLLPGAALFSVAFSKIAGMGAADEQ